MGGRLPLMTRDDYHIVMKTVRIAELKAKLSEYLRGVRRGESVTVMDRNTPVAMITPYNSGAGTLTIRPPLVGAPRPGNISLPPPLATQTDVLDLLLAERQVER